jgi:hypothetical protein
MSKQKEALKKFIPVDQKFILTPEFSSSFHLDIEGLEKTIADMPVTYGGAEDPIAYLHYFINGYDYYITEKDAEGGVLQAFGLVVNSDGSSLGSMSIQYICKTKGMNIDFHWTPVAVSTLEARKAA